MPADSAHYDVIIVGAGMVGASLACALTQPASASQSAPRVLLVEAADISLDAPPAQPGFDMRSTVLSASSSDYLGQLGLWSELEVAAEPISTILVSDQGRFGSVKMSADEAGVPALGYVTENIALGRAFNSQLLKSPAFSLQARSQVLGLQARPGGMSLQVQHDDTVQTLSASLVVLAEGGRSSLPAQLGITHQQETYAQCAIIANLAFTKPHSGRAWERFTPRGPLALLPLADRDGLHRAALVWTHPAAQAQSIMQLSDSEFMQRLQAEFGPKLGTFTRVGTRACYPLNLSVASEQVRPGLVLLGNVAHTLHPVAGQGFNLALRDTMMLAKTVRTSLARGEAPGSSQAMQGYLRQVSGDQQHTITFSHYMTRLFSSQHRALGWLRQWGMASIDLVPPLRRSLGRQAMGYLQAQVKL